MSVMVQLFSVKLFSANNMYAPCFEMIQFPIAESQKVGLRDLFSTKDSFG